MASLPPLSGHEVLKALLKGGFYIRHQRGSHARLFHTEASELRVTVPVHGKALPERTLRSILKQANLTVDQFVELVKK
jgi:predicted RNA binding protein YcfA (HicA-like mRNA interferase family)